MPFANAFDNQLDLQVSISALSALIDLAVYLDFAVAKRMRTDQMLSPQCWLSTLLPGATMGATPREERTHKAPLD